MKMTLKMVSTMTLAAAMSLGIPAVAHADDSASQDKKFLIDAGKGNLAEVDMAKLALTRSSNPDVRAFATKMIHDHTMLQHSIEPFAAKDGIKWPTKMESDEQDEYNRLSKKSGESFDKDYITTMVDDHHHDLQAFKTEIDNTQNPALKEAVEKGYNVIKGHAEMIDGIAHKYNMPAPNQPSGL